LQQQGISEVSETNVSVLTVVVLNYPMSFAGLIMLYRNIVHQKAKPTATRKVS